MEYFSLYLINISVLAFFALMSIALMSSERICIFSNKYLPWIGCKMNGIYFVNVPFQDFFRWKANLWNVTHVTTFVCQFTIGGLFLILLRSIAKGHFIFVLPNNNNPIMKLMFTLNLAKIPVSSAFKAVASGSSFGGMIILPKYKCYVRSSP